MSLSSIGRSIDWLIKLEKIAQFLNVALFFFVVTWRISGVEDVRCHFSDRAASQNYRTEWSEDGGYWPVDSLHGHRSKWTVGNDEKQSPSCGHGQSVETGEGKDVFASWNAWNSVTPLRKGTWSVLKTKASLLYFDWLIDWVSDSRCLLIDWFARSHIFLSVSQLPSETFQRTVLPLLKGHLSKSFAEMDLDSLFLLLKATEFHQVCTR